MEVKSASMMSEKMETLSHQKLEEAGKKNHASSELSEDSTPLPLPEWKSACFLPLRSRVVRE